MHEDSNRHREAQADRKTTEDRPPLPPVTPASSLEYSTTERGAAQQLCSRTLHITQQKVELSEASFRYTLKTGKETQLTPKHRVLSEVIEVFSGSSNVIKRVVQENDV